MIEAMIKTLLRMAAVGALVFTAGNVWAFQIDSPAFKDQEKIPAKYTCDGEGISPPLVWTEIPKGTKSFALISDDPDAPAGTWVHWVLYDLPENNTQLQEGVEKSETLPMGAKQGMTDFKEVGYGPPCPPPGKSHRYFFKLYALNQPLSLPPKATKAELLVAMNGHVLAHAELAGLYEKQ